MKSALHALAFSSLVFLSSCATSDPQLAEFNVIGLRCGDDGVVLGIAIEVTKPGALVYIWNDKNGCAASQGAAPEPEVDDWEGNS